MRTAFNIPVLTFLLMAASSPCFALMEIEVVSTTRARELGVAFRTNINGEAGTKVWIEFKTQGELKNFTHVELRISDGGKHLVTAPLFTTQPSPGQVAVFFSADPAYLPASVLTIAVQDGPRSRTGYQFKVQDFIAPETAAKKSAAAMPIYVTAEQVKAMPPVKATVEHIETYLALFKTADGRKFRIGDERGEQDVWHFVGTALKVGETYELPAAFLDYQNKDKKKKQ